MTITLLKGFKLEKYSGLDLTIPSNFFSNINYQFFLTKRVVTFYVICCLIQQTINLYYEKNYSTNRSYS